MMEMTICFKSEKENIANVRNMIATIAASKNQTLTFINELKTIVSEGITNSIVHGYKDDNNGEIIVKVITDNKGIYLSIIDFGCGIADVEKAREIMFSTLKDNERSGLGFTIMEVFSTTFDVKSTEGEGTILDIYKEFE